LWLPVVASFYPSPLGSLIRNLLVEQTLWKSIVPTTCPSDASVHWFNWKRAQGGELSNGDSVLNTWQCVSESSDHQNWAHGESRLIFRKQSVYSHLGRYYTSSHCLAVLTLCSPMLSGHHNHFSAAKMVTSLQESTPDLKNIPLR
jgi:hypothetical protein